MENKIPLLNCPMCNEKVTYAFLHPWYFIENNLKHKLGSHECISLYAETLNKLIRIWNSRSYIPQRNSAGKFLKKNKNS